MCSALLQEQQIQYIIIFDRIQRKTGKHFKRFPVFLLVQQLRQTLHRAAMVAGHGLGVKQTAQDAFLHALGHRAEERVDGVVVEHLQGEDGRFRVMRDPVGRGEGEDDLAAAVAAHGAH